MISRYWKGLVKPGMAEDYLLRLKEDTLDIINEIDGFQSATVLRKDLTDGAEFVVITEWESMEAIKRFAASDVEKAVVPDITKAMMITYDDRVIHYEVASKL